MPGLLSAPSQLGGLLSPVVWDRLRQQKALGEPMLGSEGARPSVGGGARGWTPNWNVRSDNAYHSRTAVTPSGLKVILEQPVKGGGPTSMSFYHPGEAQKGGLGSGSTGRGIKHFGEVFQTLKDYVGRYKPDALEFTALTDGHQKLYDKLAPMLANELGGKFENYGVPSFYRIALPESK